MHSNVFQGVCIDTGAQASVVGKDQAKAYCHDSGVTFKISPSNTEFKFGDGYFKSLAKCQSEFQLLITHLSLS